MTPFIFLLGFDPPSSFVLFFVACTDNPEQYVDTRTFDDPENSPDFTENLRDILLGAIDREIDG
jgi:hypothetical protein